MSRISSNFQNVEALREGVGHFSVHLKEKASARVSFRRTLCTEFS